MKNKAPAFMFYPKDYLTDGKVLAMRHEVRSMYWQLLCIDWIEDGFPASQIGRLAGYEAIDLDGKVRGEEVYNSVVAQLLEQFQPHPSKPGLITNKRLLEERQGQQQRAEERRLAGAKGGKANRNKKLKPKLSYPLATSSATSSATHQLVAKRSFSFATADPIPDPIYTNTNGDGWILDGGGAVPPSANHPQPSDPKKEVRPGIRLTVGERWDLVKEFGLESFNFYLDKCSEWLERKGEARDDSFSFLKKWIAKDLRERVGFYKQENLGANDEY
jgi:hypothetical protein